MLVLFQRESLIGELQRERDALSLVGGVSRCSWYLNVVLPNELVEVQLSCTGIESPFMDIINVLPL